MGTSDRCRTTAPSTTYSPDERLLARHQRHQRVDVARALTIEPVPVEAADHYARVKMFRRTAGTSMDENDLWIAATALALGAVLVTRDKDYTGTPDLLSEDWTK